MFKVADSKKRRFNDLFAKVIKLCEEVSLFDQKYDVTNRLVDE